MSMLRRSVPRLLGVAALGTGGIMLNDDWRAAAVGRADGGVRFLRTTYNAGRVAVDYKMTSRHLPNVDEQSEEYKAAKNAPEHQERLKAVHLTAATRLLDVAKRHGGVYTKFGQYIASMNHVLPKEYTETLSALQDKAALRHMTLDEIETVVREDFGRSLSELFAEFDPDPVASASLAQVHRAKLHNGDTVAVKVQYLGLKRSVRGDLWTMKLLARLLGYFFPDFEYTWMFPEFEENLHLELNFEQEGRNGDRVAEMFDGYPDVCVPEIYWDRTSKRVLTMEFVEGLKIDKVDKFGAIGADKTAVASTVSRVFSEMVMYHGFVHCDPHPGNMLVRVHPPAVAGTRVRRMADGPNEPVAPGAAAGSGAASGSGAGVGRLAGAGAGKPITQLVVLDHGMYRRLTESFRSSYCRLWKAMVLKDNELLVQAARELHVGKYAPYLPVIFTFRTMSSKAKLGKFMSTDEVKELKAMAKDITWKDVNTFMESLPRDMLFVSRSSNLVRSLNMSLGGTSQQRFRILGESALHGLLLTEAKEAKAKAAAKAGGTSGDVAAPTATTGLRDDGEEDVPAADVDPSAPGLLSAAASAAAINDPVASEGADMGVFLSLRHSFDVWRLRMQLVLIDMLFSLAAWWTPRDMGSHERVTKELG